MTAQNLRHLGEDSSKVRCLHQSYETCLAKRPVPVLFKKIVSSRGISKEGEHKAKRLVRGLIGFFVFLARESKTVFNLYTRCRNLDVAASVAASTTR